jgi:hypothetical protein
MTAGDAHAHARWARRGDIALRVVAAVPLAYATASVTAALIALGLCAIAAMWAFAARSGWRAIWTLAVAAGIAAAIAWVSIDATGRV